MNGGAIGEGAGGADSSYAVVMIDPNDHDRFVLRQRIRLVINQYQFSLTDRDPAFCFVEQARFKFKEDIRFYADDRKTTEVMRIRRARPSIPG